MRRGLDYVINLLDGNNRGATNAQKQVESLDKSVESLQNRTAGGLTMGGLVGGNLIAQGISKGLSMISSYGTDIIRTTANIQGYENAIRFASGSSEEGAHSIDFLKVKSNELGLSLESSFKGFKTFQGALMNGKFSADQVRTMFSQVQTATAAMNLTAEDSEGVYLALGQVMSKGKVQAEELRGQIGERIPGAFQIAARSMGVTTQQLDKMMSDGKLMADDFLPKFASELSKTFEGALPQATDSLQANFNRMDNSSLTLKKTLGEALSPAVKRVSKDFTGLLDDVTRLIIGQTPLTDKLNETKIALNAEFNVLKDGNISYETRLGLIKDINSQAGQYLTNLLDEKSTIADITKAQNEMNNALSRKIATTAKEEILADEMRTIMENEKKRGEILVKVDERRQMGKYVDHLVVEDELLKKKGDRLLKNYNRQDSLLSHAIDVAYGTTNGSIKDEYKKPPADGKTLDAKGNASTPTDSKPPKDNGSISSSTSGGSVSSGASVKYTTVNVKNLVESLYLNSTEPLNNVGEVRRNIGELLLRAIADYEQVAE